MTNKGKPDESSSGHPDIRSSATNESVGNGDSAQHAGDVQSSAGGQNSGANHQDYDHDAPLGEQKVSASTGAAVNSLYRKARAWIERIHEARKRLETEIRRKQQEYHRDKKEDIALRIGTSTWKKERAHAWRANLFLALLIIATMAFGWAILREIVRSPILVEPFAVPEDLNIRGYTPTVTARRIRDHMRAMFSSAEFSDLMPEAKDERFDPQVPVAEISVGMIATQLRETVFNQPRRRVSGDITILTKATTPSSKPPSGDNSCAASPGDRLLHLVVRYSEGARALTHGITCPEDEIELLLRQGGEMVAYMVSPLPYAAQMLQVEEKEENTDFDKTLQATEAALTFINGAGKEWIYSIRGRVFARLQQCDQMRWVFRQAVALHKEHVEPEKRNAYLYMNWADAEVICGNVDSGEAKYKESLRVATVSTLLENRSKAELFLSIGEELANVDREDTAIESAFLPARDIPGKTLEQHIRLGKALRTAQLYTDAEKQFDQAIDKVGGNYWDKVEALEEWGKTLTLMSRGDEAERRFRDEYPIDEAEFPEDVHYVLGKLLAGGLAKREAALIEFKNLAKYNKLKGATEVARVLLTLDRPDEAALAATQAVELAREPEGRVLAILGEALSRTGKDKEALEQFNRAELKGYFETWTVRSKFRLLKKLGSSSAAERYIGARAESDPDVLLDWASVLSDQGRMAEAVEKVKRYLESHPSSVIGRHDLGIYQLSLGQFEKAIDELERAHRNSAQNPLISLDLGRAYFHAGHTDKAYHQFDIAAQKSSFPFLFLWMVVANPDARHKLEDRVKSMKLEEWPGPILRLFMGELTPEELIAAADGHELERGKRRQACEAYFYIGHYYLQRGKRDAAISAFQNAVETNVREYIEYESARLQLEALGQRDISATPEQADATERLEMWQEIH